MASLEMHRAPGERRTRGPLGERTKVGRSSSDGERRADRSLDRRAARCRRMFLQHYPGGYRDPDFIGLERDYKLSAAHAWQQCLSRDHLEELLDERQYEAIAQAAVRIEGRTNLLFSFEKMALRDAVRAPGGARAFAEGLHDFLHGDGEPQVRFERWVDCVASLPRKQTRVLTWPLVTVFGMIGAPDDHIFLKPVVTRVAAEEYGVDFDYASRPSWDTYASLLAFAARIRRDTRDLGPRDMIDLQSFIWVLGSDEYR